MPSEIIQWYPGHMAKTERMIKEMLPEIDFVIEITDARIPFSSANPKLARLTANKPRLNILTKSDLSDPEKNDKWKSHFEKNGKTAIFLDANSGAGVNKIKPACEKLMAEKLEKYRSKGMDGRALRAMITGVPNVGKSSLINRMAGGKRAKVENRPGVTREKQWITTSLGFELLDTPGMLWPKFENQTVGENLALTGAIRDEILDIERMAVILCSRLASLYPEKLSERYKLNCDFSSLQPYELFELIGRKRGFIVSGGEINTERTAVMLLDEFRSGKIGRISLESPDEL